MRRDNIITITRLAALAALASFVVQLAESRAAAAEDESLAEARKLKAEAIERIQRARGASGDDAGEMASASALLERARDILAAIPAPSAEVEKELSDVNALIYWCHKMTVVDIKGKRPGEPPPEAPEPRRSTRRERVQGKGDEARAAFESALSYAKESEGSNLLIAARLLEMADAYPGTEWSRKARTLAASYEQRASEGERIASLSIVDPAGALADSASDRKRFSDAQRATLVEDLGRKLEDATATDADRAAACRQFIENLPDDSLHKEVASLLAVFSAASRQSRVEAARRYFDEFPDGRLGGLIDSLRRTMAQEAALAVLVEMLTLATSDDARIAACREFASNVTEGELHAQVRLLESVYTSPNEEEKLFAWATYVAAFPAGFMMTQAEAYFLGVEELIRSTLNSAVLKGSTNRAGLLCAAYLRSFRRRPAAEAVIGLAELVHKAKSVRRAAIAKEYLEATPRGEFSEAVRSLLAEWRQSTLKKAYARFTSSFTSAATDAARHQACAEFLDSFPDSAHAREASLLATAFGTAPTSTRLATLRSYLAEFESRELAPLVAAARAPLLARREQELWRSALAWSAGRRVRYGASLRACREYLKEFPDGAHAVDVRASLAKVTELLSREAAEFENARARVEVAKTPQEAIAALDVFLQTHGGGPHAYPAFVERSRHVAHLRALAAAEEYDALARRLEAEDISRTAKADACLRFLEEQRPDAELRRAVLKKLREFARTEIQAHAGAIRLASIASDSKTIVTVDADAKTSESGLRIWALDTGRLDRAFSVRGGVTAHSAEFLPESGQLVLGEDNGSAMLWDLASGSIDGRYRLSASPLVSMASLGESATLVTASSDDELARAWDVSSWSPRAVAFACKSGCSAMAASQRGGFVALGGVDGRVVVYESGGGEPLWSDESVFQGRVDDVTFAGRGACVVAVSHADARVAGFNAFTGRVMWERDGNSAHVAALGSVYIVTEMGLHHAFTGGVVAKLDGSGPVAASPDGRYAFAADGRGGSIWYVPALLTR